MGMSERSYLGFSPRGFHRVAYTQWGDDHGSRVAICAHGLARTGRDFDTIAAALSDQWRVLCPDVVGRGRSDWIKDPSLYGFPQYLTDMVALIARSGAEQVDWIGTSMGGVIGMLLAAQPNTPIRRLVLNDVGPFIGREALERIKGYLRRNPHFPNLAAAEAYLREVLAPFGRLSDDQWRHIAVTSTRVMEDGRFALHYDPSIVHNLKLDMDLWVIWDMIRCPVLVLRGVNSDLLAPETVATMKTRGPTCEVVEIPDCGHAPSLMQADQIALVRAFLAR
ncbi:MAG: alpha/beta hydrolase [Alphaproteobacteria bacterium]